MRSLLDAVLIDTYAADPRATSGWLRGWGANLRRCTLTEVELAERLVVATVATVGRRQELSKPGGWFRAWCRRYPISLYANAAIGKLCALAEDHARDNRALGNGCAGDPASPSVDQRAVVTAQSAATSRAGAPGVRAVYAPGNDGIKVPEPVIRELWPAVVARFPAAEEVAGALWRLLEWLSPFESVVDG